MTITAHDLLQRVIRQFFTEIEELLDSWDIKGVDKFTLVMRSRVDDDLYYVITNDDRTAIAKLLLDCPEE